MVCCLLHSVSGIYHRQVSTCNIGGKTVNLKCVTVECTIVECTIVECTTVLSERKSLKLQRKFVIIALMSLCIITLCQLFYCKSSRTWAVIELEKVPNSVQSILQPNDLHILYIQVQDLYLVLGFVLRVRDPTSKFFGFRAGYSTTNPKTLLGTFPVQLLLPSFWNSSAKY